MGNETADLVLELLRSMRADMQGLRVDIQGQFASLSERSDSVETQVRDAIHTATASVGSLLTEMQDLKTRVTHLEGARS